MFIGHFAVGFAAKRVAPRVPLALSFAAAQLADLLWPVLVAVGAEQVRIDPGNTAFTPLDFVSYPYSHSLVTLLVWGLALGLAYSATMHRNGRSLAVLTGLVLSHWVLDALTHRPDMPVYPGGPKVGLGLWNSIPATIVLETAMFAAGAWIYSRATRPRDGIGRWSLIALVIVLYAIYLGNVFGGPPPSVTAIWMLGIVGGALLIAWSWWVDRHRAAVDPGVR
jgi:hypothetical protein